jgi:hypothetical protein
VSSGVAWLSVPGWYYAFTYASTSHDPNVGVIVGVVVDVVAGEERSPATDWDTDNTTGRRKISGIDE